jgi:hypothetical protein
LKGYSLDAQTMRQMCNFVIGECAKEGIRIVGMVTDGQLHRLICRDEDDKPLTRLQLQKDVWRECQQGNKCSILAFFKKLCCLELGDDATIEEVAKKCSITRSVNTIQVSMGEGSIDLYK